MAFAHTLATAGTPPTRLHVAAVCSLDPKSGGGVQVTRMEIQVTGQVAGLDQAGFAAAARQAEQGCPIANAIRGNVAISVTATLEA
jgi:lipoyl-dependent peroxiredoxin